MREPLKTYARNFRWPLPVVSYFVGSEVKAVADYVTLSLPTIENMKLIVDAFEAVELSWVAHKIHCADDEDHRASVVDWLRDEMATYAMRHKRAVVHVLPIEVDDDAHLPNVVVMRLWAVTIPMLPSWTEPR